MLAILLLSVAVMTAVVGALLPSQRPDSSDEAIGPERVELHRIRRQLEVAWLNHQGRGDAMRLRRELDRELRDE